MFPALRYLDLSNNLLDDTLPAGWGQALKKLETLDLGDNVFCECWEGCAVRLQAWQLFR